MLGGRSVAWSARSERKPPEKTQTRITAVNTMRMDVTVPRTRQANFTTLSGVCKFFVTSWLILPQGTMVFIWNGSLAVIPARMDDQR